MADWLVTVSVDILTSSVANPSVITTRTSHGFVDGDEVEILDHQSSTPDINDTHVITWLSETTFSIPVNVTDGGIGGRVRMARLVTEATLQIDDPVNEVGSARCSILSDPDGSMFRPATGAEVVITEDGERICAGTAKRTLEHGIDRHPTPAIETEIEIEQFLGQLDRVTLMITLAAGSLLSQLTAFVAALPVNLGFSLDGGQVTGVDMPEQTYEKASALSIWKDLIDLSGFNGRCDNYKVLSMFEAADQPAPSALTTANVKTIEDVEVESQRKNYANKVTIVGGSGNNHNIISAGPDNLYTTTAGQTKILLTRRMDYFGPVQMYVTRSGITSTEYVDGTAWTYDDTDYSINKGTAAAMGDGDTIQIGDAVNYGYWAKYPMYISAEDPSFATDPWEVRIEKPGLFTRAPMQQLADAELALRLQDEIRVRVKTLESGQWFSGQSVSLTFGWRNVSGSHTILHVQTVHVKGEVVTRTIVALKGDRARPTRSREIYRDWYDGSSQTPIPQGPGAGVSGGQPAPPHRSVQFNHDSRFAGVPEFIFYKDENSLVCGDDCAITAELFESCQVFGQGNEIADV